MYPTPNLSYTRVAPKEALLQYAFVSPRAAEGVRVKRVVGDDGAPVGATLSESAALSGSATLSGGFATVS